MCKGLHVKYSLLFSYFHGACISLKNCLKILKHQTLLHMTSRSRVFPSRQTDRETDGKKEEWTGRTKVTVSFAILQTRLNFLKLFYQQQFKTFFFCLHWDSELTTKYYNALFCSSVDIGTDKRPQTCVDRTEHKGQKNI